MNVYSTKIVDLFYLRNLIKYVFLTSLLFFPCIEICSQKVPAIIENGKGVKQLIVNGEPFIFLAGELNSSSSSNLEYLAPRMENLKGRNLNSVIASISWELFEPQEGKYDFTLVKGIIDLARKNNLKLILIWFGTWKNASSTYVPEWIKTDVSRFPRMQIEKGKNTGALSAFGENALKADVRAFSALMKYIKEYDAKEQTVLMMQVENETGILGSARDHSEIAEEMYNQPVPDELLKYLDKNRENLGPEMKNMIRGSKLEKGEKWEEVFSYGAEEAFSAWYISRYVNAVAKGGKGEYNIPMYVNAWLDGSFSKALIPDYPSGGPVSKMFDIWKAGAPSIDVFAADAYLNDLKLICKQYSQGNNLLFFPELEPAIKQGANVYYVIGQNGMCFSPFGIDNSFTPQREAIVGESYKTLKDFLPFFSQHCGKNNNIGFLYTDKKTEEFELGGYKIEITYLQERDEKNGKPESAGLIINTDKDEFYICGLGLSYRFYTMPGDKNTEVEILSQEEGLFVDGKWKEMRRINGDETEVILKPSLRRISLHKL